MNVRWSAMVPGLLGVTAYAVDCDFFFFLFLIFFFFFLIPLMYGVFGDEVKDGLRLFP